VRLVDEFGMMQVSRLVDSLQHKVHAHHRLMPCLVSSQTVSASPSIFVHTFKIGGLWRGEKHVAGGEHGVAPAAP
jgi:hypothetical protein